MSFNRSSLISLHGEPFNIDVSSNPHLNPYQRRSLSDDLNKGFYKYIGRLKYDNHYLLIDFVDERFDLFCYEGKYSSISNEFLASKLMDEIRGRVVARFSDEVSALWKENCLVFIDRIQQVIDSKHIILHRAFWMEKYVDGEDEVIDFETIINEVALLRNRWLGILKGLDSKQWQMGHIVRLRTAGMEDITV